MKNKKMEIFSFNTLLFFMIRGSFLGLCVTNLFRTSGEDSWISILIAILFGFFPLLFILKIMDKYPDKNIYQILEHCFGKFGKLLSYFLSFFVFILSSFVFWNLVNFVSSQMLHKTPNLAIGFIFLLAMNHLLLKGLNVISRVSVILFYLVIIQCVLCFTGLFYQIDTILYQPLITEGFSNIFKGAFNFLSFNILPIFILLMIPKNSIKRNKELTKNSIYIYLLATFSLFFIIFLLIGIYGIDLALLFQYPEYHLLKRITLLGFVDRIENILCIQWLLDIFIFLVLSLNFVGEGFSLKKEIKYPIACLGLLLFTNILFTSSTSIHNFMLKYLPFISFIIFFGVTLMILIRKKPHSG